MILVDFLPFGYIDPGTGFTVVAAGGAIYALLGGALGFLLLFFKKIFRFFKRNWKKFLLLLILIGGILGILFLYAKNADNSSFRKKIVILGMDGLSPDILEPLMESGRMPHFKTLASQGGYRRLATTNPPQSPIAWTAFSTGRNPGKTGLFDFIMRDPKDYSISLSLTRFKNGKPELLRKGPAFWDYASDKKIPTVLLSCPVTFPPQKLHGRMLSGMGVPDLLGTEGTFSFYTTAKLEDKEDVSGHVFLLPDQPTVRGSFLGPKIASASGSQPAEVSFELKRLDDSNAELRYQNHVIHLKKKEWSSWLEVEFSIGFLQKCKGIFRVLLIENKPELKLYISPIQIDPKNPFFPISYPSNYSRELAEHVGQYATAGMPMPVWALNEGRIQEDDFVEDANQELTERLRMLDYEMKRFKRGILFCYFESPDIIQHMFWRYRDKGGPLYQESAPEEYKLMIESWYEKMDAILGDVMSRLSPEDTLWVLSDHGFTNFRRAAHLNSWLKDNGYQALKGDRRTGRDLLADVDWSRTKAYAVGFGGIYINQTGREESGIVPPGEPTERLKSEIRSKLLDWHDPANGQALLKEVYLRETLFWGDEIALAPDLFLGLNSGYGVSWQTAVGATPAETLEDNLKAWSGNHLVDPSLVPGIFFSNQKILKEAASLYDLTPTLVKWMGFSEEEIRSLSLDGQSLM